MSKYTTDVRSICEINAGLEESVGSSKVDEVIAKALPNIFDFKFPIFDEKYRSVLETKILKHFYTREIAFETVGLWKLKLNTKLNEIMPYYNQLYESELLEFNPLYDVDVTRKHTGSGSSNSETNNNGNSNSTSTNWNLYNDTPQGAIDGIESGKFLTNATKDTNNVNNTFADTTKSNANTTDEYLEIVSGKQGGADFSTLLKRYRETFLNIDMLIIDELEDLFFQLW